MSRLARPNVFVETERLSLRNWRPDDASTLQRMVFGDPKVMEFSLGVRSVEETAEWIERVSALQAEHGFAPWAVEDRSTSDLIGLCGLAIQQLPEGPFAEVGYRIAYSSWGRGFATEAARSVVEWAWEHTEYPEVTAIIHPDNQRSARVAEKVGMQVAWETDWEGMRHRIYAINRPTGERA